MHPNKGIKKPGKVGLSNVFRRVYNNKYQQRIKTKVVAQKARLVDTKEKFKTGIRKRRMKK